MKNLAICGALILVGILGTGGTSGCGSDKVTTNPSGSSGDTFQPIVGQFCDQETTVITRTGNDAEVVMKWNTEETRLVEDANGFVRTQTVRGCFTRICLISGGAGWSDALLACVCEFGASACRSRARAVERSASDAATSKALADASGCNRGG